MIDDKFASDVFLQNVREMDAQAQIRLDNESLALILVGHAMSVTGEAGHIFRQTPQPDRGIVGEIEFKNDRGEPSGERLYLQLQSGDAYRYQRKRDGQEIFTIKNALQAKHWQAQDSPVMLVMRTADGEIRWMNVTAYLKQHGTATKQIVFEGEPFTALNVARMRA